MDIHGFHHRNPFDIKRLDKIRDCNNGQNYIIVIYFFCLVSVRRQTYWSGYDFGAHSAR
jgi:hypothetical protein